MTSGISHAESALDRTLSLTEALEVASFTEVVKGFVDLYGIGIKVFDVRGDKLCDISVGNGDFCAYVFSTLPAEPSARRPWPG